MDYWKILGLSDGATVDEIKTAFRTLAKQYHPDHNNSPEAEKMFREVHEAYEVLSKNPHYNSSSSSTQDYDFYYYSHDTSSFEGSKYEYDYGDYDDDLYDDDFEEEDDYYDEYEDEDEYYDTTDSYYNHLHQTRNNKEQNTPPDYSLSLKDKIYMAIAIIFGLPILLIVCFFMVMVAG